MTEPKTIICKMHLAVGGVKVDGDVKIPNIDCSGCTAPCCRVVTPLLTPEEATSGKYPVMLIGIPEALRASLPEKEKDLNVFVLWTDPVTQKCTFLGMNGKCLRYNSRPSACRRFDCRIEKIDPFISLVKKRFDENGKKKAIPEHGADTGKKV